MRHQDGMSSELIEGEPSYLEAISFLSPSMPAFDVSPESTSKPILDPDDPPYAPPPKSYDDPIIDSGNPLRHPRHGSHEGYKSD